MYQTGNSTTVHPLERLAPLGIMGYDYGAPLSPLNPSNITDQYCTDGFKGGHKLVPQSCREAEASRGRLMKKIPIWWVRYPQRNLFEILLNQTEIRLYLPFSNWLTVLIPIINWKIMNTIWLRFDITWFWFNIGFDLTH